MLTPEEQAAFSQSVQNVRQAAERRLRSCPDAPSLISFAADLQSSVSRVLQSAAGRGVPIACKAGCSHCCNARVEASAPEIFRIVRELEIRPEEERRRLLQRLESHAALPAGPDAWNRRPPCPFLEDGWCAIYRVRPNGCRKAHSLEVAKCRDNAPEIPQDLGVAIGIEALLRGTAEAYRNLGLEVSGHELVRALLAALSDPSAESRWARGEPVFGDAA